MQPIKLQRERKLNRAWNPKGKVWFQKNVDYRDNTEGQIEEKFKTLHKRSPTTEEVRIRKRGFYNLTPEEYRDESFEED